MSQHDLVIVLDFGAQYAQLIARRVREARVYSEIMPHTATVAEIVARRPKAIILSGGPQSVYAPGAPQVDPRLFQTGVPAFGICYGFQAMARALGGDVARTGLSEFGRTEATIGRPGTLLAGIPEQLQVWMSHGDAVAAAPGRLHRAGQQRGRPDRRLRGTDRGSRRRAVAPRGAAHPGRPAGARALPVRHRRLPAGLDGRQHRRRRGRRDPASRWATST